MSLWKNNRLIRKSLILIIAHGSACFKVISECQNHLRLIGFRQNRCRAVEKEVRFRLWPGPDASVRGVWVRSSARLSHVVYKRNAHSNTRASGRTGVLPEHDASETPEKRGPVSRPCGDVTSLIGQAKGPSARGQGQTSTEALLVNWQMLLVWLLGEAPLPLPWRKAFNLNWFSK